MGNELRGLTLYQDIYPKILELLPKDKAARILDLGAGNGYFSQMMRNHGYQNVTACDLMEDTWQCPDIPFVKADLSETFPFPDESFDCVVSIEVIEHIENHGRFMKELVRITRKGGAIIISTPNTVSISSRWYFFIYGYSSCSPVPIDPTLENYQMRHINPIGLPQILFFIERFGAELVDVATNRKMWSMLVLYLFFKPIYFMTLRWKFLTKRYAKVRDSNLRHIKWMLKPAVLMGKALIVVAHRKK